MNKSHKTGFKHAGESIDEGLSTLFATLGDALTTMLERLEDGQTGSVQRDHVLETSKGPIRAHAGIKLRMAGLETTNTTDQPQPFNPNRESFKQEKPNAKTIVCDLIDDNDEWVVTAELPGVATDELKISKDGSTLLIATTGARSYAGQIEFDGDFSLSDVSSSLRNGILTLRIGRGQQK